MTTIGEAWVRVRGDTSSFSSEVSSGVTGALKKVAEVAGAIVIGKGIVDFLKGTVSEAGSFNASMRISSQVIKDTGGTANVTATQVGDLARSISVATGVSVDQIAAAQQVILAHRGIRNELGAGNDAFNRTIQDSTDLAAVMGTDTTSAAKLLGKALDDPAKAAGALHRAGVILTQGQQDQIAAFVAAGDALGAQKLVLDSLEKSVGGAAAAGSSATSRLKAEWADLRLTMGQAIVPALGGISTALAGLIPAVAPLMSELGTLVGASLVALAPAIIVIAQGMTSLGQALAPVIPMIGAAVTALATFFGQGLQLISGFLGPFLTAIGPVVAQVIALASAFGGQLIAAVRPLMPILAMIASSYLTALGTALGQILTAITPLLPVIGQLAAQILTALAPGFIALVTSGLKLVPLLIPLVVAFVQLLPVLLPIVTLFGELVVWLSPLAPLIVAVLLGFKAWAAIQGIIEGIKVAWAALNVVMALNPFILIAAAVVAAAYIIYRNWDTIVAAFRTAWHFIEGIMGSIASVFKKNWDIILAVFTGPIGIIILIWRRFGTQIKDGLQAGLDFLKRLPGLILGAVTALPGILLGAGVAMLQGLLNGMIAGGAFVLKWMIELPIILLALAIKFDILLVTAGINLLTGLVNGIKAFAPVLWGWFTSLPGEILRLLAAAQSWLVNTGVQVLTGLVNGIISIAGSLWNFWTGLPGRILSLLGGAASWLLGPGRDIIQGLLSGIQSLLGNLWDFFSGIPGRILGILGNLGGLLLDAGRQIIQGLINGIGNMAGAVGDAIHHAITGGINTAKNILGIASPSTVFHEMGLNLMQGLTNGILAGAGGPNAALNGVLGGLNGLGSLGAGGAGGSATATSVPVRTGPGLLIQEAHFHNEADVELVFRKAAFAITSKTL